MNAFARLLCIFAGAALLSSAVAEPPANASKERGARKQAARATLGVYQGAGCSGLKRLPTFVSWLGRQPDHMLEFIPWDALTDGTAWAVKCWSQAGTKSVVYSMPMLPPDRSATLAQGAAGKFDALFDRYARILVQYGYGDSIIRLGWEFNGHWYPWESGVDPQSWIAYWRRIVTIMRAVPGANFKFDWNPAGGWTKHKADQAYPGDEYVDIIGLDYYNSAFKPGSSAQEHWQLRLHGPHGLKWHRDFARAHGKPMSFPEWGTGWRNDGSGGGDDPYFIERMADWIGHNNVLYHIYWDYPDRVYSANLSDGSRPRAGAAFRRIYGRDGAARD
jgi:hypothetical protein